MPILWMSVCSGIDHILWGSYLGFLFLLPRGDQTPRISTQTSHSLEGSTLLGTMKWTGETWMEKEFQFQLWRVISWKASKTEIQKEKRMRGKKRKEKQAENDRELWDKFKSCSRLILGVPDAEERKEEKKYLKNNDGEFSDISDWYHITPGRINTKNSI